MRHKPTADRHRPAVNKRTLVQLASLVFANSYVLSILKFCPAPVLNCHACPTRGPWLAPIGSAPAFHRAKEIPLCPGGIPSHSHRSACWPIDLWVGMPFGFLQDILFKIKLGRKKLQGKNRAQPWESRSIPGLHRTRYLSAGICYGENLYFVSFALQAGLEAGLPLVATDSSIRAMIGTLFIVKMAIVLLFVVTAILIKRPFCRFGLSPWNYIFPL